MIPGDKSLSHRALMLAALTNGICRIENLGNGRDILTTIAALRSLGVRIDLDSQNTVAVVHGCSGKLSAPENPIDCANSGTTMRLLSGILAAQPFETVLVGDQSLSRRPMDIVAEPLNRMGAEVHVTPEGTSPIRINGSRLRGIVYAPDIASAQVKSAVLLAGLFAEGSTVYHEKLQTRDHTERMLGKIGGRELIEIDKVEKRIRLNGERLPLPPFNMTLPGDASSAAFPITLATLLSESSMTVPFVLLNPGRIAYFRHIQAMGGVLVMTPDAAASQVTGGEPVGDISVQSARLRNVPIDRERIPAMIDELPLLALMSSLSDGNWEIRGASRLRVKETDRIRKTCELIHSLGGEVEELDDGMRGPGGQKFTGGMIDPEGDHRIAMAGAVGAWVSTGVSTVKNIGCADISFPGFFELMQSLLEYEN